MIPRINIIIIYIYCKVMQTSIMSYDYGMVKYFALDFKQFKHYNINIKYTYLYLTYLYSTYMTQYNVIQLGTFVIYSLKEFTHMILHLYCTQIHNKFSCIFDEPKNYFNKRLKHLILQLNGSNWYYHYSLITHIYTLQFTIKLYLIFISIRYHKIK